MVFRKVATDKEKTRRLRCGLALIDMTALEHVKLLAMLHQVKDKNSYLCNDLDLDALWDFLFETGFIYPKKYALIHKNKEQIKQTYEKLYTRSPEIARHFVYQDNGAILGHMAMVRFWKSSWLIHHHAARKSALNRAGLDRARPDRPLRPRHVPLAQPAHGLSGVLLPAPEQVPQSDVRWVWPATSTTQRAARWTRLRI